MHGLLLARLVFCFNVFVTLKYCQAATTLDSLSKEEVPFNDGTVKRFQESIRFKTVSFSQSNISESEIVELQQYIIKTFPSLHNSVFVKWEVVNKLSLLYTIQGSDPNLTPYMLAGHLDVVPANPEEWEVEPFEGTIVNDYIYGRGTVDDKHAVMGILESLEFILSRGVQMKRTLYVAFGGDEEVHGYKGAKEITDLLLSRGVKDLEFILDEGMTISEGFYPFIKRPIASVGVAEKGAVNLKLTVYTDPGHSSVPPRESAIGILARAITRLEDYPQPHFLGSGPEAQMFSALSDYAFFPVSLAYGNLWFFSPILSRFVRNIPVGDALQRTTTAFTIIQGGIKENVIPSSAYVIVNHRVHPSQSVPEVIAHDRRIINDDRVKITVMNSLEARSSSPSDQNAYGYQMVKLAVEQVVPNIIVGPNLVVGNTDCKWYQVLSKNVYNFTPTMVRPGDEKRFHGKNERISIKNYEQCVQFYYRVIMNANLVSLKNIHQHSRGDL